MPLKASQGQSDLGNKNSFDGINGFIFTQNYVLENDVIFTTDFDNNFFDALGILKNNTYDPQVTLNLTNLQQLQLQYKLTQNYMNYFCDNYFQLIPSVDDQIKLKFDFLDYHYTVIIFNEDNMSLTLINTPQIKYY